MVGPGAQEAVPADQVETTRRVTCLCSPTPTTQSIDISKISKHSANSFYLFVDGITDEENYISCL